MKNIFLHPEKSLTAKLIIAVGLLIVVGSFVFWYALLHKQEKDLVGIAVRYGGSFIDFVKKSTRYSMLNFHRAAIQQTLEDMSIAEGVSRVRIFDHNGRVFFSSQKTEVNSQVDKKSIACKGCHLEPDKSSKLLLNPQEWTIYKARDGYRVLKIIDPIPNEPSCYTAECHIHSSKQKILGFVEADLTLELLDKAQFRQGLALTGYVAIFILAISASLGIILYKLVSKPVSHLVYGMEKVAAGNLDHFIPIKSFDEIGVLTNSFNSMIKDIKAARQQQERFTQTLEAEVAKKTEEIQKTQAGLIQTEKLASLGRMAAGVAHEINNPLTGIVTFAHLMLKRVPPDSEDAEDLKVIIEQSERCAKIIKNLLTFARAIPSEKGKVPVNELLSRTINMVRNQEKFYNIKFDINLDPKNFVALGETSQFQQIFLNMLINAADAMNERGTVTIATRKITVDNKPFVEIEFTDTGSGIPDELQTRLFEPFFTTKPVGKGTGLGLSVSHGIVRHYGGQILVKSTVGKGTSFFVRLHLLEEQVV
ncbi:MAG: HAMP domain-containing protein [Nitrospirae bacterium]|nr:HAMP domain-containing protein [Nitrospirota bacterium]